MAPPGRSWPSTGLSRSFRTTRPTGPAKSPGCDELRNARPASPPGCSAEGTSRRRSGPRVSATRGVGVAQQLGAALTPVVGPPDALARVRVRLGASRLARTDLDVERRSLALRDSDPLLHSH